MFWYDHSKGYFETVDDFEEWYWSDVEKIQVFTTDEGPFNEDLYWVISFVNCNHCLYIPQLSKGSDKMITAISEVLSEPNWDMAIKAMGSCENDKFLIWSKN